MTSPHIISHTPRTDVIVGGDHSNSGVDGHATDERLAVRGETSQFSLGSGVHPVRVASRYQARPVGSLPPQPLRNNSRIFHGPNNSPPHQFRKDSAGDDVNVFHADPKCKNAPARVRSAASRCFQVNVFMCQQFNTWRSKCRFPQRKSCSSK